MRRMHRFHGNAQTVVTMTITAVQIGQTIRVVVLLRTMLKNWMALHQHDVLTGLTTMVDGAIDLADNGCVGARDNDESDPVDEITAMTVSIMTRTGI